MKALRYLVLLLITASIWCCLTPLAQAQEQCLAPQIEILAGGSCNDCFMTTVRVTNLNDPINGIVNIEVAFSTDGAGGVCPIAPQVPSFITGTATFSFEVGREGCCTCGAGFTFTDACCGSSTDLSLTSFSRPDNHVQRDFSIVTHPTANSCQKGMVTSVEFIEKPGNIPLSPNNISVLETGQKRTVGKRIFPDEVVPKDTASRQIVRVIAHTTGFPTGTPIYFKSFDVDDSSTNLPDVDCNGPDGNDNRGSINNGTGTIQTPLYQWSN